MRGKADLDTAALTCSGITPAHAGKRCHACFVLRALQDHPRPCGEKPERAEDVRPQEGSPPPMRGKGLTTRQHGRDHRITPAHAGKSFIPFVW